MISAPRPLSKAMLALAAVFLGLALAPITTAVHAADSELKITCDLLTLSPDQRLAALDKLLTTTHLTWPAGHMTLIHAIELLGQSGNSTSLAIAEPGDLAADLPAFSGDYWQGVIEVCHAFDLTMETGLTIGLGEEPRNLTERANLAGVTSVVQGGPLILCKRPATGIKPIYVSCGSVLGEVGTFDIREHRGGGNDTNTMDVLIKTRLEPHVSGEFGRARLLWSEVTDDKDKKLKPRPNDTGVDIANAESPIHFADVPEHLTSLHLTGELLIEQVEPFSISADLKEGETARGRLNDQDLVMHVMDDKDAAANQRIANTTSITVTFPETLLWAYPTLKIEKVLGGDRCGLNGWHNGNQRVELSYLSRKLTSDSHTFVCSGHALIREAHLPMKCLLRTDDLPKTELNPSSAWTLQTATQVSWTAGHRTIKESLDLLSAHGNNILLELGQNEQQAVDVPAFSGNFWDGAIQICRTYGLTMIPPVPQHSANEAPQVDERGMEVPSTNFLAGGPLILGAQRSGRCALDSFRSCGPLLMLVEHLTLNTQQGLAGLSRKADISYRLRLEPHFDMNLIDSASLDWATFAGESDGHPLTVEAAPDENNTAAITTGRFHMRVVRRGNVFVQVAQPVNPDGQEKALESKVTIDGLPAGKAAIDLPGQVNVSLSRDVHCELKLAVGAVGVAHLDGHALGIRLFANGDHDDNPGRAGITIDQGYELPDEALNVRVVNSAGETLRVNNTFGEAMTNQQKFTRLYAGITPGEYTVFISTKRPLLKFCLPVRLVTSTP